MMATSPITISKVHPPSYIFPGPTTTNTGNVNESTALSDIKLLCSTRKKRSKRHIYLNFNEISTISSDEQPALEIIDRNVRSSILFNECISFESFDTIKNDLQFFIYVYFQSYTVSIYFSEEKSAQKPVVLRHFESMYQKCHEQPQSSVNPELPTASTDLILHSFDTKLIPYQSLITRDHPMVGPVRLYLTNTDLYIASINSSREDLRTTIINQCPSKEKQIMCIPYFTIKHYGNRSRIFLIEIGKSSYGDGEIQMKCPTSTLAKTIHLLVSPVIAERPSILCTALCDQFLTDKRREKSKNIQPPIQLSHDVSNGPIIDLALPFLEKSSTESVTSQPRKSHSILGIFRKLVQHISPLQRSATMNEQRTSSADLSEATPLPINESTPIVAPILPATIAKIDATVGSYVEMGRTVNPKDEHSPGDKVDEETVSETISSVDMGVNTTITLSPHVRSAIIVGNSVHLIAEEKSLPIGTRSFTSPACVMQPFRAQLTSRNIPPQSTDCPHSSHQSMPNTNSHHSLLLSYGFVTISRNDDHPSMITDPVQYNSNVVLESADLEHRLNSDFSIMSFSPGTHQSSQLDNILSDASSSSQIFRTLSLSTTNIGDNQSTHRSIIVFDDRYADQTSNYLLGPPKIIREDLPMPSTSPINEENHPTNDPYALVEPIKKIPQPMKHSSDVNYTDLVSPSIHSNNEQNSSFSIDDETHRTVTTVYTDIDHHQTNRRNRLEQIAALSTTVNNRTAPFIL